MILDEELEIDVIYPTSYAVMNLGAPHAVVRVTHIPSGLTVLVGTEDTKMKNRDLAVLGLETMLRERGDI